MKKSTNLPVFVFKGILQFIKRSIQNIKFVYYYLTGTSDRFINHFWQRSIVQRFDKTLIIYPSIAGFVLFSFACQVGDCSEAQGFQYGFGRSVDSTKIGIVGAAFGANAFNPTYQSAYDPVLFQNAASVNTGKESDNGSCKYPGDSDCKLSEHWTHMFYATEIGAIVGMLLFAAFLFVGILHSSGTTLKAYLTRLARRCFFANSARRSTSSLGTDITRRAKDSMR